MKVKRDKKPTIVNRQIIKQPNKKKFIYSKFKRINYELKDSNKFKFE